MSEEIKCITTCAACGNYFEYTAQTKGHGAKSVRRVCDDCRRATKKRHRKWELKGELRLGAHYMGEDIVKMDVPTCAARLGLNEKTVRETERRAILKIRNHPLLKELFDIWKGEGAPVLSALVHEDIGPLLLEYQMSVIDWYAVHDRIVRRAHGETAEARQCLQEIEKFQQKIIETLGRI